MPVNKTTLVNKIVEYIGEETMVEEITTTEIDDAGVSRTTKGTTVDNPRKIKDVAPMTDEQRAVIAAQAEAVLEHLVKNWGATGQYAKTKSDAVEDSSYWTFITQVQSAMAAISAFMSTVASAVPDPPMSGSIALSTALKAASVAPKAAIDAIQYPSEMIGRIDE